MDELENKFYKILESHNHEIGMDFVWLVNLAHELAEAAQQNGQTDLGWTCDKCGTSANVGYHCSWCEEKRPSR
jgi:hypothetical protein